MVIVMNDRDDDNGDNDDGLFLETILSSVSLWFGVL
jgi:hypothetical protein